LKVFLLRQMSRSLL